MAMLRKIRKFVWVEKQYFSRVQIHLWETMEFKVESLTKRTEKVLTYKLHHAISRITHKPDLLSKSFKVRTSYYNIPIHSNAVHQPPTVSKILITKLKSYILPCFYPNSPESQYLKIKTAIHPPNTALFSEPTDRKRQYLLSNRASLHFPIPGSYPCELGIAAPAKGLGREYTFARSLHLTQIMAVWISSRTPGRPLDTPVSGPIYPWQLSRETLIAECVRIKSAINRDQHN